MSPKIIERIDDIHTRIKDNQGNADGRALAKKMKDLASAAIFNGIRSRDWEKYMREFATTDEQLKRLLGEDEIFNSSYEWAKPSLIYIVANSTCDVATTTGTRNNMSEEMIAGLDNFPEQPA